MENWFDDHLDVLFPADATRTTKGRPPAKPKLPPQRTIGPRSTKREVKYNPEAVWLAGMAQAVPTALRTAAAPIDAAMSGVDVAKAAVKGESLKGPLASLALASVPFVGKARGAVKTISERAANDEIAKVAQAYLHGTKITPRPLPRIDAVDKDKARNMAYIYAGLKSTPEDNAVREAYQTMAKEVDDQFKAIADAGYKIEWVDEDAYKNSAEMMEDLRKNKTLKVLRTNDENPHPLLTKEQNDKFRAVHDFFGHAQSGNQFGPKGEELAFRDHSAMFSPQAARAMATETRGQNSWVNFGPHSHKEVTKRPFAEQKAALWPEELMGDYADMKLPPEMVLPVNGAAIEYPDGRRFLGQTHGFAALDAIAEGLDPYQGEGVHGFVTNLGRFIDRNEAYELAKRAKQTTSDPSTPGRSYGIKGNGIGGLNAEMLHQGQQVPSAFEGEAGEMAQRKLQEIRNPQLARSSPTDMPMSKFASASASEKVVAAAIRRPDGSVKSGPTHFAALDGLAYEDMTDEQLASFEEGFLTNTGRFVSREDAARIAGRPRGSSLHTGDADYPAKPKKQKIEAPAILPADRDVFDVSKLGRDIPAGVSTERPPVKYPTRANLDYLEPLLKRFRTVYTPNAIRGLEADPTSAGRYDMTQIRDAMKALDPKQGESDFKMFMRFMGPTSIGTKVPENLKQASKMFELWKNGNLNLDELKKGTLQLPYGYSNRRQKSVNSGIARILEEGNLDPIQTPKTFRFANQLAGDYWGGAALDMHVGRQVGLKGLLTDAAGEEVPAVGFPKPSYKDNAAIGSSPENNQYAVIEDALIREAKKMGLAPAQYQSAGWVGGAKKTGVADPRSLLSIFNEKLRTTADKYGYGTTEEAFKAFARGDTPLWAILPFAGAGLLGDRNRDERR